MRLKDKTAVISGVGNRFGKAAAYLFAKEGAKVILVARKDELIKPIAEDINREYNSSGGGAGYIVFDVTNKEDVERGMEKIIKEYGKIDILFNNAGGHYSKKHTLEEMDVNSYWDNAIVNNLRSVLFMCQNAVRYMKKNGGGSIINVSAAGKTLVDGSAAYGMAKGGIISFTKNLAREVREDNIRVNCVRPGVIRNEFNLENLENPTRNVKRKGNSEDVAHAVLYFASDNSSWVTGQTLVVDGGEELFLPIE